MEILMMMCWMVRECTPMWLQTTLDLTLLSVNLHLRQATLCRLRCLSENLWAGSLLTADHRMDLTSQVLSWYLHDNHRIQNTSMKTPANVEIIQPKEAKQGKVPVDEEKLNDVCVCNCNSSYFMINIYLCFLKEDIIPLGYTRSIETVTIIDDLLLRTYEFMK